MKLAATRIRRKRAYEASAADDGTRVLVDRLWPRGVRKVDAAVALWMKDVAPSTPLRKWFGHDPARWDEFRERYLQELHAHPELLDQLRRLVHEGTLTLVYAAHDEQHNHAMVLREFLLRE